ncbi:hypothetical protein [Pantoea sp. 18069]|uniref:hypothetical protein n=1 Tax=Pantoea sp. 18069 TaxID=2681415 RepID=UPI00135A7D61|nr:hypothetical protein [Pantoea sp. 18069]
MRICVFALLYALASLAQATPGGLDARGCHHPKNKEFHCHAPRDKAKGKSQGSAETPAQREKRLLRECRGRPNAGACLGYAKQAKGPAR